jgi:hypothetical protein
MKSSKKKKKGTGSRQSIDRFKGNKPDNHAHTVQDSTTIEPP